MDIDLKKDIEEFDLIFLDVETTGLNPKEADKICEVAALKVKKRQIIDTFYSLINPQKNMPYGAYIIHKISNEQLVNAPTFEKIAKSFVDFIKDGIICAYNADFDLSFINYQLKKASFSEIDFPVIDILEMAKTIVKLSSYKLENVANFFNISFSRLHRSLDDAKVSEQIFFKLVDNLKEKNLNQLGQYISIFGASSFYKERRKQKIDVLREVILKKINLAIEFFSCNQSLEKRVIKPISLIEENKKLYLWYEDNEKNTKHINVDCILKIHLV
ncbi:MAG: 3'-5' exonuclease [Candidatus Omnitrophica bacterium]|nr:3'-5' exonuclease [Candidatus Omnitrophota bacterium]MCM8831298.1 3'-5' exonuclease [Candidatus Omnitrophota bacterium]